MHSILFHMEQAKPTSSPTPAPVFWLGNMGHYGRIERVRELEELAFDGKIELTDFDIWQIRSGQVPSQIKSLNPKVLVQRPTTWPKENPDPEHFPEPCFILNLAVGSGHLKNFHERAKDWLILPDPDGYAASTLSPKVVAQLTVTLAVMLQRNLVPAAALTGQPQHFHNQYQELIRSGCLLGSHWLCLAGGKQVRELLPLLKSFGVGKVSIWDRELDPNNFANRFKDCLQLVAPNALPSVHSKEKLNNAEVIIDGMIINFTNDYTPSARLADVVSIHAGSLETRENTAPSPFRIGGAFLSLLKPDVLVINPARGMMVDEEAIVCALREQRIAGYATDVLYADAEQSGDPEKSPLWQFYLECCDGEVLPPLGSQNLVITPHIGGSVEKLFAAFLDELVPPTLERIGIAPASSKTSSTI